MKTALYRLLGALALQPRQTLRAWFRLPRYLSERRAFQARSDWPIETWPCLLDRDAEASALGEYFWQDLHVARRIIAADPRRHIDVGSRIDGFIAHLACVRAVEVFDIRPLAAAVPNVRFRQWDLMAPAAAGEQADCVSCLHTLEHIGLGRYGDPIDPEGWKTAVAHLAALVSPGGRLWLAVPVGRRRVAFNAHRVFEAREVLAEVARHGLDRAEFGVLAASGEFEPVDDGAAFEALARRNYGLGLFVFERPLTAGAA
jgi:Caenorhabditis protein of unknown function, DUF268